MPHRKILTYYTLLLVLLLLTGGYLVFKPMDEMSMPNIISICTALVLYSILISITGETRCEDEREVLHRNLSNRAALIAGTFVISAGLIYQMFVSHTVNWWLLTVIIVINITKISSLIFYHYKK
ncbi:MAG: hypothetical protein KBC69_03220 [Candidatus Magasanikbacteria bacterium]|nr:hypothetical protein [Candidatus Magasanikbacteria bacterium]